MFLLQYETLPEFGAGNYGEPKIPQEGQWEVIGATPEYHQYERTIHWCHSKEAQQCHNKGHTIGKYIADGK